MRRGARRRGRRIAGRLTISAGPSRRHQSGGSSTRAHRGAGSRGQRGDRVATGHLGIGQCPAQPQRIGMQPDLPGHDVDHRRRRGKSPLLICGARSPGTAGRQAQQRVIDESLRRDSTATLRAAASMARSCSHATLPRAASAMSAAASGSAASRRRDQRAGESGDQVSASCSVGTRRPIPPVPTCPRRDPAGHRRPRRVGTTNTSTVPGFTRSVSPVPATTSGSRPVPRTSRVMTTPAAHRRPPWPSGLDASPAPPRSPGREP